MHPRGKRWLTLGGLVALAGGFAFLYWKIPSKGIPPAASAPVEEGASRDAGAAPLRDHVDERRVSKELRRRLFADQTMKDDLVEQATVLHELKPTLMLLDNLNCERGLREKNLLLADASPPPAYAPLLDAYAKTTCGDRLGAIALLQKDLLHALGASFATLTTWSRLRALGVEPGADVAREVLGVIVETLQVDGVETIAVYSDGNSSYADATRSIYLPEERSSVKEAARQLVSEAAPLLGIAQKEKDVDRPLLPGKMRLTFLTPSGPWACEALVSDVAAGRSELLAVAPALAAFRQAKVSKE